MSVAVSSTTLSSNSNPMSAMRRGAKVKSGDCDPTVLTDPLLWVTGLSFQIGMAKSRTIQAPHCLQCTE
jgi:hypothetical protein